MRCMVMVVATIFMLLAGCADPEPVDCRDAAGVMQLQASSAWSDDEFAALQASADRWTRLVGRPVVAVTRGDSDTCSIVRRPEKELVGPRGDTRMGHTWQKVKVIEIAAGMECNWKTMKTDRLNCISLVTTHEMGHAMMGDAHLPGETDGIMRGTGGTSMDWTSADRAACVQAGVCE